jgi:integrase/recombinase XerD
MSALSRPLCDYLRLRRSFGHDLADAHRLLPRFVDHMEAIGAEFVTIDAAVAWSLEPDAPPGSTVPARRMMAVRGFARYLAGVDPRTEIPPVGLIPSRRRWRATFIYSEADIVALMAAARRLIAQPLRAATYETLIGLLSATGLRIGEAIKLDRGDIDWAGGVLLVRESKFHKSRLVPLQESSLGALRRYAQTRDQLCPRPTDESFFVSLSGTRLIYVSVCKVFRMLCEETGVGAGSATPPRIHGIRHTFAVNVLLGWYREGVDVQARLHSLSTYMGHRVPRFTFTYLSATPELLAYAAGLLEAAREVRS